MAHELSLREDGTAEMAYVGEKPWHGLGQELKAGASIEEWQVAAGMDWKIQRSVCRYNVSRNPDAPEYLTDTDHHVLFRSDNLKHLAVVSDTFKVVQPSETLEFFRDLVANAGYQLSTAGVLHGGRKVWAQAEAGLVDTIVGNDLIEGKLLIATACDGSMKTLVKNVTERVVCANTLSIAVGEKGKAVKVSHRSEFNADSVKAQLGISVAAFQKFIVDARELSRVPMSKEESDKFLLHLFSDLDPAVEHDPKLLTAAREYVGYRKVMDLFTTSGRGSQLPGVKGTAWGLLNGVTEYVDHARGNKATTQDNRLDYAWFGAGDALKTKAFEQAMALTA